MFKAELKTIESTYIEQSWEMTDLGEDVCFSSDCMVCVPVTYGAAWLREIL